MNVFTCCAVLAASVLDYGHGLGSAKDEDLRNRGYGDKDERSVEGLIPMK